MTAALPTPPTSGAFPQIEHPAGYAYDLDTLRSIEYPHLQEVTYLDHSGTTLYSRSLLTAIHHRLSTNLYGNPHSASPSSLRSTKAVEATRRRLLNFLRADPEHFDIVFVSNATAAIKLVVDAFAATPGGFWYGYHSDAHTSLVGVRQLAKEKRCFLGNSEVGEWIESGCPTTGAAPAGLALFAWPGQSNMTGHRLPLNWPAQISPPHQSAQKRIYTLLDAAALLTTASLNLSDPNAAPDYTALSLYKIFGLPDLGALIVKRSSAAPLLQRKYFGGGTVEMVTVSLTGGWHSTRETLHEALEDGSLPFHDLISLGAALDVHERLYTSMSHISAHTAALSSYLHTRLAGLRHHNGVPLAEIYRSSAATFGDPSTQGPVLAFNLRNSFSAWIGKSTVEKLAISRGIHLRTGGLCNPGGIAAYCGLAEWEMRRNFSEGMRCGNELDVLGGKPTGVVRVSLGAMSSRRDVDVLIRFLDECFVEKEPELKRPKKGKRMMTEVDTGLVVAGINIFPVKECCGITIPKDVKWPVTTDRGLAWDKEWCIIPLHPHTPDSLPRALTATEAPQLATVGVELDVTAGLLTLRSPTGQSASISIWESPPPSYNPESHPDLIDNSGQFVMPCEPYTTDHHPTIQTFFSNLLGFPATLARYIHPRRLPTPPPARALTVSIPPSSKIANIVLRTTGPSAFLPPDGAVLRFAAHLFQYTHSPQQEVTLLHNPQDRSPAGQYQFLVLGTGVALVGLDERVEGMLEERRGAEGGGRCVVVGCFAEFGTKEELEGHLGGAHTGGYVAPREEGEVQQKKEEERPSGGLRDTGTGMMKGTLTDNGAQQTVEYREEKTGGVDIGGGGGDVHRAVGRKESMLSLGGGSMGSMGAAKIAAVEAKMKTKAKVGRWREKVASVVRLKSGGR